MTDASMHATMALHYSEMDSEGQRIGAAIAEHVDRLIAIDSACAYRGAAFALDALSHDAGRDQITRAVYGIMRDALAEAAGWGAR